MIGCRILFSRLFQMEGDLEAAAREIQMALDLLQVETPAYIRQETIAQQVRVYLARNRPEAAEMALQGQGFSFRDRFTYPDLPSEASLSHSVGLLYNSSLCVLLYQARAGNDATGLEAGIELANRLIRKAFESEQLLLALETLLLRAQMHAALGDGRASRADYVKALELAEPEGFTGVFIEGGPPVADVLKDLAEGNRIGAVQADFVRHILEAFSGSHPSRDEGPAPASSAGSGPMAPVEPLTERELEVLHLMAEGLKYKEIASRLIVSLNTVRFHVKAIYGKLNVNNRTQAIERARQLRIL